MSNTTKLEDKSAAKTTSSPGSADNPDHDKPDHVRSHKAGHSRAVEQLYRKHWQAIRGRLYRVFGSGPPEPDDLAQEAFAKFIAIEDFSQIRNPRAYLSKIAINLGYNSVQRFATAQNFIDQALLEVGAAPLEENAPESVYLINERITALETATQQLTEKQRVILARSKFYGETYAEISEQTGWSQADISRQLNAALKVLQESI